MCFVFWYSHNCLCCFKLSFLRVTLSKQEHISYKSIHPGILMRMPYAKRWKNKTYFNFDNLILFSLYFGLVPRFQLLLLFQEFCGCSFSTKFFNKSQFQVSIFSLNLNCSEMVIRLLLFTNVSCFYCYTFVSTIFQFTYAQRMASCYINVHSCVQPACTPAERIACVFQVTETTMSLTSWLIAVKAQECSKF